MARHEDRQGASAPAVAGQQSVINTGEAAQPHASAIVKLAPKRQQELLMSAQYAGASEEMLLELRRMLEREDLTAGMVSKIETRVDELAAERKKRCQRYFVRPGSSVFFHGKMYKPGSKIQLTDEEAADLKVSVTGEAPPPPQPAVAARGAGKYRVKGPGSVFTSGRLQRPGTLLDLSAEDAQSLGEAVEYVHPAA
jgi:hypothetical protein